MSTERNTPDDKENPQHHDTKLLGSDDVRNRAKKGDGYAEKQPATKAEAVDPRTAPASEPNALRPGETPEPKNSPHDDTPGEGSPVAPRGMRHDRVAELPGVEQRGPVVDPTTIEGGKPEVDEPTEPPTMASA